MCESVRQKLGHTKVLTFSRWRNGSLHIRTCKPSSPQSSSSAIFDFDSNKHIFWLNSISLFPTIILVKFESQSKVESISWSSSDKFFGTELLKFSVHSYPCSSSACKDIWFLIKDQLSKRCWLFREEIWRLSCSRHQNNQISEFRIPNILFTCLINSRARHSTIYILKSRNLF